MKEEKKLEYFPKVFFLLFSLFSLAKLRLIGKWRALKMHRRKGREVSKILDFVLQWSHVTIALNKWLGEN